MFCTPPSKFYALCNVFLKRSVRNEIDYSRALLSDEMTHNKRSAPSDESCERFSANSDLHTSHLDHKELCAGSLQYISRQPATHKFRHSLER
jgi:hypothetical protein